MEAGWHALHAALPSEAAPAHACRRGTYPAPIHSLAFSPASVQPALLCAASGHGTVHLFRLEDPDRRAQLPTLNPCPGRM